MLAYCTKIYAHTSVLHPFKYTRSNSLPWHEKKELMLHALLLITI